MISYISKPKLWSLYTLVILISLHLKIWEFNGFGIALAFILIPFWIYYTYDIKLLIFKKKEILLIIALLFLPFIHLRVIDFNEFLKTYAQYLISYFLVIRVIYYKPKISSDNLDITLLRFQWIVVITITIQFILCSVLNITSAYNLWGTFQLYYQRPFPVDTIFRMKAFYLEPSYVGFVSTNIFWIRLFLSNNIKQQIQNFGLTLIVLVFAMSALGFLTFIILFIFYIFGYKTINKSKYIKIILLIFIVLFFLFYYNEIISLLRLNELSLNQDGISSGFMRVVLPLQFLYKTIFVDKNYWGIAFGELDKYSYNYFIDYGESGISNSLFLIIGYWGILGILFILFLLSKLRSNKTIIRTFVLLTILNLNNSGAFVTSQFVYLSILLPLLAIKYHEKKNFSNYSHIKQ